MSHLNQKTGRVSSNKYSASVIVGMKANYELELYDVTDLTPETFVIDTKKGVESPMTHSGLRRSLTPSEDNVPQSSKESQSDTGYDSYRI